MAAHDEQSGGQKTFRLARLFHTEDCYRARALTAEELVRRTFVGVDAATFKKLERLGSYYDVTNCEHWHWRFGDRFQDPPTCRDIADAAERLGFSVKRARSGEQEHFNFHGARVMDMEFRAVAARCAGCDCGCDHDADQRGAGCASCVCPCNGCFCAGNCANGHQGVVYDLDDLLLTPLEPDANLRYKSRRFALARRWHSKDCKVMRSFTADELIRLTFESEEYAGTGPAIHLNQHPFPYVEHSKWQSRFQQGFSEPPTSMELADAFMHRGWPVHYSRSEADLRIYLAGGSCNYLGVKLGTAYGPSFWWPYYALMGDPVSAHCRDVKCECQCYPCDHAKPRSGCAKSVCQCEGCFCARSCSDGHPAIQKGSDLRLSEMWRELADDKDVKRYEDRGAWWHAPDCRTARMLSADQIVLLCLHQAEVDSESGPDITTRCAKPGERLQEIRCGIHWINGWFSEGPSCTELAEAATRVGIRVERLPKRWPWERAHYWLVGASLNGSVRLESAPSCTGCECFCPLCDDCSNCRCECAGCVCSARCATGMCSTLSEVIRRQPRHISDIERRLGSKRNSTPGDLAVSEALVSIEQGVGPNQSSDVDLIGDDAPRFELRRKAFWHREGCEHPPLTINALEMAYVTLRMINEETIRDDRRFGRSTEHTDCELWKLKFSHAFYGSEPDCALFVAAVKRLGYEVKPVEGMRYRYSYYDYELDVQVEREGDIHYEFPNAEEDGRLWQSAAVPDWDVMRCDGMCECGCRSCYSTESMYWWCECSGCYCPKTCVPARTEE